MRGKVIVRVVGISSRGITPAYAGKSIRPQPSKFLLRDHPRLCGEKGAFPALSHRELGSPPPMRGKDSAVPPFIDFAGITPAYAGKSFRENL